jgi:hypothetical protein
MFKNHLLKRLAYLLLIISSPWISSCSVQSFYPLYTADVLVSNSDIIGTWRTPDPLSITPDDPDTLFWQISSVNDTLEKQEQIILDSKVNYTYSLILFRKSSPSIKTAFNLHLVSIKDQTYLDIFPEQWAVDNAILGVHLIGVHTFAKAEISEDSLTINWFDANWFQNMIRNNRIRIKYEDNGENILLTASPEDLQRFVAKYGNEPTTFDSENRLILLPMSSD